MVASARKQKVQGGAAQSIKPQAREMTVLQGKERQSVRYLLSKFGR